MPDQVADTGPSLTAWDLKEKLRSLGALPGPDLTPGMAQEDAAPPIEAAADGAAEPNPSSAGE